MSPDKISRDLARFEDFELAVSTAELRKADGTRTRLPEQSLRILLALLERPGEVVQREDLRKRLWPNDTVVEFEHSISAAMNRLRQALGDSAENPRFIETLARRGYRWKTAVEWETSLRDSPAASPVPAGSQLIGKRVSHYRVLEIIGGGGMGVVYKAEDIKLGRRVALKFLPDEVADDAIAMERFEREARAASALNHPNICTIHAVDEHDGRHFIVMELLEGKTLRDWMVENLDSGIHRAAASFPLERCVDIAVQVAEGLAAAHEKGIIHRDIKPANIFLTSGGRVKILDFGLAKLLETELWENTTRVGTEPPPDHSDPVHTLTRAGLALGTAGYMSPEQVRGEHLDARSDIFSFGLVLYEMTSGRRAFAGQTASQLHSQILDSSPTPLRELNPRVPLTLEQIIERALQKDRAQRYQSATDMRSALDHALRDLPRWKTREKILIACAVTMVPIIAAAVWFETRSAAPRSSRVFDQRQLTVNSHENPVTGGEISPDGKYLVYTDLDGIHLKQIDSGESQLIKMPVFSGKPTPNWELGSWLPDSTHFMAIAELPDEPASLWNFPIAAGQPRKIAEGANPWGASPDGLWVVITRNGDREVWLTDPSGEHPRKLWESTDDSRLRAFTWSPDGRRIAYIRNRLINGTDEAQIESRLLESSAPVVMLSGKAARDVTQLDEGLRDLNWLPDGRLIFVGGRPDIHESSCNLWDGYVDPRSGMFAAPPQPLTNWAGFCVTTFSHTADGRKFVFTRSSNMSIVYAADFDPARLRLSTPSRLTYTEDLSSPTGWTADGSEVYIRSNRENSWGIYRQPLRGGPAQPIVTGLPNVSWSTPVSPDGRWLLYYSANTGETASPIHLMRIPLRGGPAQEVARGQFSGITCARVGEQYCVAGEVTSDRKHMVFSVVDPLKGVGPKLAEFADENPSEFAWDLSPDGKRIVLHREMGSDFKLLTLGKNPAVETIRTDGGVHLRMMTWAADGRGVFASSASEHGAHLVYVDLSGRVRELWELPGYHVFLAGRSSPDGRHVAIQESTVASNVWMIQDF